jgi:hypothetical protein
LALAALNGRCRGRNLSRVRTFPNATELFEAVSPGVIAAGDTYALGRNESRTSTPFIAAGLKYVLLVTVLFAPGTILYFWARREQNARLFTPIELAIFAVVLVGAAVGVYGLATGLIMP